MFYNRTKPKVVSTSKDKTDVQPLPFTATPTDQMLRKMFTKFVCQSFRDQADRDYIAARTLFRVELYHNFLWPAVQAIEKYLKAILLFSYRPVKKYNHNLKKLLKDVGDLPDLAFNVPTEVERFICFVLEHSKDRYLVEQFSFLGRYLNEIDWTVWHLRRYCQDFLLTPYDDLLYEARSITMARRNLDQTVHADPKQPTRLRLQGGYLEKVMEKPSRMRADLVWYNPCYYSRRRPAPFRRRFIAAIENPVHVRLQDRRLIEILDRLVKL